MTLGATTAPPGQIVGAGAAALVQALVLIGILYWVAVHPIVRRRGIAAVPGITGDEAGRRLESGGLLTATAAWASAQVVFETTATPPLDSVFVLAIVAGLFLRFMEPVAQWLFAATGSVVKLSLLVRSDCFGDVPLLSVGGAAATLTVFGLLLAPVLLLRGRRFFTGGPGLLRHRLMRAFALVELASLVLTPGGIALWASWSALDPRVVAMTFVLLVVVALGATRSPELTFPVLGVSVFVAEVTLAVAAACHSSTLALLVIWFVIFGLVVSVKR